MIKSRFVKALILGICLTVGSAGAVYASSSGDRLVDDGQNSEPTVIETKATVEDPDRPVSSQSLTSPEEDNDILQKQREIDQYVFVQYKDEIAKRGFMVTYTGPQGSYVEIGIEPYSEDNAEYLYKIFGKEMVKVVEGQQAYTMGAAPAGSENIAEGNVAVDIASDARAKDAEAGKTSILVMLAYVLGAVTLLGVAVVAIKRILPSGK